MEGPGEVWCATKAAELGEVLLWGLHAKVRVGTTTTENLKVSNGLRQGCTQAPTSACGSQLTSCKSARARLSEVKVTETKFADDAPLYTTSWHSSQLTTASSAKWRVQIDSMYREDEKNGCRSSRIGWTWCEFSAGAEWFCGSSQPLHILWF